MFKKIDPSIVINGTYAKWNPTTKAVYHVICCVADYRSGELYYSVSRLAEIAGVSVRSAQYAIRKLESEGIIRIYERQGRANVIVYNFVSTPAKDNTEPLQTESPTPAKDNRDNVAPLQINAVTYADNDITPLQETATPASSEPTPLQSFAPTPAVGCMAPLQNRAGTPATGCTHNKSMYNEREYNEREYNKTTTGSVYRSYTVGSCFRESSNVVVCFFHSDDREVLRVDSISRDYAQPVPQ